MITNLFSTMKLRPGNTRPAHPSLVEACFLAFQRVNHWKVPSSFVTLYNRKQLEGVGLRWDFRGRLDHRRKNSESEREHTLMLLYYLQAWRQRPRVWLLDAYGNPFFEEHGRGLIVDRRVDRAKGLRILSRVPDYPNYDPDVLGHYTRAGAQPAAEEMARQVASWLTTLESL